MTDPFQTEAFSQTLLAKANGCPHSAYLYRKYRDQDHSTVEQMFGTAGHLFCEEAMRELIQRDEPSLYAAAEGEDPVHAQRQVASLTAAMVDGILREHPELAVPARHHSHSADHLRQCAYHWAVGYDRRPDQILGLEQTYELDVAGVTVRGRIDVVAIADDGETLAVDDYKFSYAMPDQAMFEDKLQVPLYLCLLAYGNPVDAEGNRLESLGRDAQWFRGREIFPRYLLDSGELGARADSWSRTDLADFMADLERLVLTTRARFGDFVLNTVDIDVDGSTESVQQIEDAARTFFPAVPGSHCSMCPAEDECPLPRKLRDHKGTIRTMDQATEVMRAVDKTEAAMRKLKADCKRFASEHGPIPFGTDQVFGFEKSESWKWDYESLTEAVTEAAVFGKPFDLNEHRAKRVSMRFKKIALPPDEPADAKGEEDVEAQRDEKYGAATPF